VDAADARGGFVERASRQPRRKRRILERYGWGLAVAVEAELGSRREWRASAAVEEGDGSGGLPWPGVRCFGVAAAAGST
jgi:hypothetical protein